MKAFLFITSQTLVLAEDSVSFDIPEGKKTKVVVSGKCTLEVAEPYVKDGRKVCVLNFASATNTGDGVTRGSSAQEAIRVARIVNHLNMHLAYDCNSLYDHSYVFDEDEGDIFNG